MVQKPKKSQKCFQSSLFYLKPFVSVVFLLMYFDMLPVWKSNEVTTGWSGYSSLWVFGEM